MAVNIKVTDGGRQSSGFLLERHDCTVRSFACAADVPYSEAHRILQKSGRKNGKGWYSERGLAVAKKEGLLDFVRIPCSLQAGGYRITWPTLAQIIARYKTGRYIICTRKHSMALIDGVIHDTGLVGLRSRVRLIHEVKPIQAKPAITQAQVSELWERLNKLEAR